VTNFALYEYSTNNIGDDIQSIAARRFLPRVDYFINRDQLSEFPGAPDGSLTKLVANGWYMHKPYGWPPNLRANLDPLLISMYIKTSDPHVMEAFFSQQSLEYFHAYGRPIGVRDLHTLRVLESKGIPAYWSGCLTLTLTANTAYQRGDFVLAIDVSDAVYEFLRDNSTKPVWRLTVMIPKDLPQKQRFELAEYYLYLYQTAHAIVSSRLHVVLPATAFETPVLLVKERTYNPQRYSGLQDLVRNAYTEEYLDNFGIFDVNGPTPNPDMYLAKRSQLVHDVATFTGYDSVATDLVHTRQFTPEHLSLQLLQIIDQTRRDGERQLAAHKTASKAARQEQRTRNTLLKQRYDQRLAAARDAYEKQKARADQLQTRRHG